MKISVNWMQQIAGDGVKIMPKGGIDELVRKIGAQLGAVEEVVDLGKRYQHIVIAQVVECQKHPNADKLHVCKIDDGGVAKGVERDKNGNVQVVCGAPNVREGLLVAWLPPGSTVPSSFEKDPFTLEARELRGVVSNGMLASASELAISDDHSGILEIDGDAKPGDDFAESFGLNDYVIDIENKMFTHRPDCFGQLGVAREIAGISGQAFTSPKIYSKPKSAVSEKRGLHVKVVNELPELVPRFMAQVFENVTVGPSPVWMQTYLARLGVRPINNIVDITNYFMLMTGQPMHAYDYDKVKALSKSEPTIVVRKPKKGEKVKLLNGKEIEPWTEAIMIATDKQLIGVGGVMGGSETEVDDSTKNIILECANFDMYSIRRTAMHQGLFTEAVTRFNKGQSPLQCDRVLAWARGQIQCDSGGLPAGVVDEHAGLKQPGMVRLSAKFVNDRLGLELGRADMSKLLTNVEFGVEATDNKDELKVTPPFWRTDIEIAEDLVEEIGRLYGFDHLPLQLPSRSITPTKPDELTALKQNLRETLSRAGANEVLTYTFTHGDLFDKVGQDRKHAFKLSNALSPELQYFRTSLLPSLLDKVHMNIKAGYDQFALFELNKVHYKGEWEPDDPKVPLEDNHLALVISYDEKRKMAGAPYYQARKYLEQVVGELAHNLVPLADFDLEKDEWGKQLTAPYEPLRSAVIVKDEQIWGVVGEFKSSVRRAFKLPAYCAGFEINLGIVNTASVAYRQLPRYPKVEQDISLKVPANTSFQAVYDLLAAEVLGQPNTLAHLQPLDIYQRQDDTKHKQLSFRLTIASYEKTLKSEEVNTLLDNAADVAKEKLHAERI